MGPPVRTLLRIMTLDEVVWGCRTAFPEGGGTYPPTLRAGTYWCVSLLRHRPPILRCLYRQEGAGEGGEEHANSADSRYFGRPAGLQRCTSGVADPSALADSGTTRGTLRTWSLGSRRRRTTDRSEGAHEFRTSLGSVPLRIQVGARQPLFRIRQDGATWQQLNTRKRKFAGIEAKSRCHKQRCRTDIHIRLAPPGVVSRV